MSPTHKLVVWVPELQLIEGKFAGAQELTLNWETEKEVMPYQLSFEKNIDFYLAKACLYIKSICEKLWEYRGTNDWTLLGSVGLMRSD